MRENVNALVSFYEGRLLFRKGDGIWRNAKPRQPELAYAWMLEAQKKYRAACLESANVEIRANSACCLNRRSDQIRIDPRSGS